MRRTRQHGPFDCELHDKISAKDRAHHAEEAALYDKAITGVYAMYHHWDLHPWIHAVARRRPRARALDLGTGTGVVAFALARAGFHVVGVDHSPEMLAKAMAALGKAELGFQPCLADLLKVPFGDGSFDVVTLQGVLHHVPHAMEPVLLEVARLLRPGGEFYCSEPCADSSPVGRVLRSRLFYREYDPEGENTDEEAVEWKRLKAGIQAAGLKCRARFLTHVPSAHFHYWLPEKARLLVTRLVSLPFSRGDLLFVHGSKPA